MEKLEHHYAKTEQNSDIRKKKGINFCSEYQHESNNDVKKKKKKYPCRLPQKT